MIKCEFCKTNVSDKGFRCFIKRTCIAVFVYEKKKKDAEITMGDATFQIRICDECLKKKGINLESK